jgi:tetratricopeptide (TPR) repeat protein
MRSYPLLMLATTLLFTACGSGSKRSFNQAREYESSGLFVEAAEADLKALRQDSDFKEALLHLKEVAPKAYQELLSRARHLEQARDWDQAVHEYEHLDRLLAECHQRGVVFATEDVKSSLAKARQRAADYHFDQAEQLAGQGNWQESAFAYLRASDYIENYNGSLEKGMNAFLQAGDQALAEDMFDAAVTAYEHVLQIRPNHPEGKARLAEAHYRIGRQLFADGDYRASLHAFETVLGLQPGYKDSDSWRRKAYDAAVQFVAIFPFVNESRQTVDGYFIATEVYGRLRVREIPFLEFMPSAESLSLLREATRNPTGRVSEAEVTNIARNSELDAIVWGKIKEVVVRDKPEEVVEYEDEVVRMRKNESGEDVEEKETIFFREHRISRFVRVRVEYFIIEVETGKYLDNQRFSEDLDDLAVWIGYQGSVYDLPEDKRAYVDAPRQPQPLQVILDKLLLSVSDKVAREVEQYYD